MYNNKYNQNNKNAYVNKQINKAIKTTNYNTQQQIQPQQPNNKYVINNLYIHKDFFIKESKNGILIDYKNICVWINKNFIKVSNYTNFASVGICESWEYLNNNNNLKINGNDLYNHWNQD